MGIVKLCMFLYNSLKDNKKNYKNRHDIKKYFYQKILNDITMALSLIKKCTEKENDDSAESNDLKVIYFFEAYYYFELAMDSINKNNIIEYPNKDREDYDKFLLEMNPCMIRNTLAICENALKNMIIIANDNKIDDIEFMNKLIALKDQYNTSYCNIKSQIEIIENKKEKEEIVKNTIV